MGVYYSATPPIVVRHGTKQILAPSARAYMETKEWIEHIRQQHDIPVWCEPERESTPLGIVYRFTWYMIITDGD